MNSLNDFQFGQLTSQAECFIHTHPKRALNQTSIVELQRSAEPKTVSTAYALTYGDEVILSNPAGGSITLSLPVSSTAGYKEYRIVQVSVGTTVIARTSTDTIKGTTSVSLTSIWSRIHIKATNSYGWVEI